MRKETNWVDSFPETKVSRWQLHISLCSHVILINLFTSPNCIRVSNPENEENELSDLKSCFHLSKFSKLFSLFWCFSTILEKQQYIALWSRSIQNSNGRLCVVTQWGKGLTEPVGYGLINMHFSLQRSEDKRGAGEITDCFTVCSWARTLQPPPFMSTSTCYCKNLGQKVVCKLCVSDTESHRLSATVVTALSQFSILFFPAVP